MRNDFYPKGTVRELLLTETVTPQSADVLNKRLDRKQTTEPSFFSKELFITLQSFCDILIPQDNVETKVDLAGCFDEILSDGKGNGWRYDNMPPDGQAYLKGLAGVNETSILMFDLPFQQLDKLKQKAILHALQNNTAAGKTWEKLPANLFFEEILTQLVELYYSHPYPKENIGDVSMADAKGWTKIGLDEKEVHEPDPIN